MGSFKEGSVVVADVTVSAVYKSCRHSLCVAVAVAVAGLPSRVIGYEDRRRRNPEVCGEFEPPSLQHDHPQRGMADVGGSL
jgi:hypothetical protein